MLRNILFFHNKTFYFIGMNAILYTMMSWQLWTEHYSKRHFFEIYVFSLLTIFILLLRKTQHLPTIPITRYNSYNILGISLLLTIYTLGFTILQAWHYNLDGVLRALPLLIAINLILMLFGNKGLSFYKSELLVLLALTAPTIARLILQPDHWLAPLTSYFASYFIWHTGFEMHTTGANILTAVGNVVVSYRCSGTTIISYLFAVSILSLFLMPVRGHLVFWIPILAIMLAFITNAMRVSLLVILHSNHQIDAFDYWHEGMGGKWIKLTQLVLFLLIYLLIWHHQSRNFSYDRTA